MVHSCRLNIWLDCCCISTVARAGHLSWTQSRWKECANGLRGRSPTGVTNEGGYPKYLTAPWILSCYSWGETTRVSGFHMRATGFERLCGLRQTVPLCQCTSASYFTEGHYVKFGMNILAFDVTQSYFFQRFFYEKKRAHLMVESGFRKQKYKVVQIWPGQTVTSLRTISPGHIWTTLYNQWTQTLIAGLFGRKY